MDLLRKKDLQILMSRQQGPCVSIFMPTERVGPLAQQNPAKFKDLLKEAERGLLADGIRTLEVQERLEPAQKLLLDSEFWAHQNDGLALFLSSEVFRHYRLPLRLKELVVVTRRFHLKPLLPLLATDGRFYILAVSQNDVRLLQATRSAVSEVDAENVPTSLDGALEYDDPEKQLQFHTRTSGKGRRAAVFHGHGVGADDTKDNILRYFRQIDAGLHELLREEQSPLILAGVEYLFPIYKEANTYPHLADQVIAGNPEALSEAELHDRAWPIVEPIFLQGQKEARARYGQLKNTERTSSDVETVIRAAHHGRVETLFVSLGIQIWGAFDPHANRVDVRDEAKPEDEDLLDFAAVHTLVKGGTVYAVEPEKVPDGSAVAAILRY